jgi:hypothetical protein
MSRFPLRLIILLVLCAFWLPGATGVLLSKNEPVIQCYVDEPTADKPQSKVWFAAGHWWAWLPWSGSGSKVWRRGEDGQWTEEEHLNKTLGALPKQVDVWAAGNLVVAAMCQDRKLAVVSLLWNEESNRYLLNAPPLTLEETGRIETVTVDRDKAGFFWLAYPADSADTRKIVTRIVPPEFNRLGPKVVLADDVKHDDICVIARMNGSMGVLWSNQKTEQVLYSRHQSGSPVGEWWAPDTVASGNETADDHLNFCKPRIRGRGENDVRLFAATKNSLDALGQPQLVARVFNEEQEWINVEFAPLNATGEPSRPIAVWLGDHPAVAYASYGANLKYNRPNWILMQHFSPDGLKTVGDPVNLLGPVTDINNVTGPKHEPAGIPVLLLASDYNGAVFEMFVEQSEEPEVKNRGAGEGDGEGKSKKK